ncbi:MAG: hypothetical protein ACRD72_17535, partial [Candidatus Angelobacter sp.]
MSMALLRVNSALWQRLQLIPHQSLRGVRAGSRGPKNALTFGACRLRQFTVEAKNAKKKSSRCVANAPRSYLPQGDLMAETVLEQILDDLRSQAVTHYPQRGDFKNLRVVGHTPKNYHFIYDV